MVGVGFTLFFSGLIGWVGGASESPCLVRLFLLSALLAIVAEIGGIIALNILGLEVITFARFRDLTEIFYAMPGGVIQDMLFYHLSYQKSPKP